MVDVDTSSYLKPPSMPVQPLDIARKFGDIQQQSLQINQAKLDQANQALTYMTRSMGSLGPDASKEDYLKVGQNAVDQGLVPQNTLNVYKQRLDAAPDGKSFYNEFMTAAADHQQQINYHLGQPGTVDTGQTKTPVTTSVKPGFGQRSIGMPVQQQTPPTAVVMDANNQPTTVGAQPPQVAPGSVAQPTPLGMRPPAVSAPVPLSKLTTGPETVTQRIDNANSILSPQPRGFAAGTPPNFDEGKKKLAEDQLLAANKMTAIKPAIAAMKLLPGLNTGPGTEPWNKAVGFLKAQGVIPTGKENDPTVVYQEADKYLHQYLKGRGGRSDADLLAAEKSSPGVGVQLNPALLNLTKSAVAQDMIEAARPIAFSNRKDLQNYGQHQATFPQSMDQRAFETAMMPEKDRYALINKMHNKYKNNPRDPEAIKFFNSLDTADKAGMLNTETE